MKMNYVNEEEINAAKPEIDTGGPAFPRNITVFGHQNTIDADTGIGMSLRDWFAGQALAGWLGSSLTVGGKPLDSSDNHAVVMAKSSYRFADAMLAERNR